MTFKKHAAAVADEPVAKPAAKAAEAEELTNETVPGGRYKGTDGTFHDANGNTIK